MNKQIGKNMFDGMELPEQTKQEVWGNLEVRKRPPETAFSSAPFLKKGTQKPCLGQTAWKNSGCIPYNGSSFRNY